MRTTAYRRRGGGSLAPDTAEDGRSAPPVLHRLTGAFNPHCAVCGRSAIWIAAHPGVPCQRGLPLFDRIEPRPVKAGLPGKDVKAK